MDSIKKIEMRPPEEDYKVVLYPKTSTDMVVDLKNDTTLADRLDWMVNLTSALITSQDNHIQDGSNPHGTTKEQVGLGNVTNKKQMPISGGQFTGIAKAQSNSSYSTAQLRNVIISTSSPTSSQGENGDLWPKYE